MKIIYGLLFWGCFCSVGAVTLPETLTQGQLVYGQLEQGERAFYRNFELVPDENGNIVFGIGRNQENDIVLQLEKENQKINLSVPVVTYPWETEIIEGVPQRTVTPLKSDEKRIAKEQKLLNAARDKEDLTTLPLCFVWPLEGRISSPFGKKRIYGTVQKSAHSGLDIAAPQGTQVRAIADGIVHLAESDLFYTGGTILIEHGSGVFSGYSHLSRLNVPSGMFVRQGDVVGEVGSTGRST
ncbi:MAG: M23 family metallopeptidase, partial [Bacteroidia bacterium]|nr:M23 family metallopeptidase [Bacteroidia bacterium]